MGYSRAMSQRTLAEQQKILKMIRAMRARLDPRVLARAESVARQKMEDQQAVSGPGAAPEDNTASLLYRRAMQAAPDKRKEILAVLETWYKRQRH